ncbi:MAG TPA: pseudouridine synthase [Verrucomicrobiota bacterium]|nr:pseudouridine synthase [Verrucomicrobiota bacterium]
MTPCILFEDEHLLVVNKPAGMNTHAPSHYAGEGIYDWLKHREPRWSHLAIIHRLDKETSGVLVFSKTPLANRSLTARFSGRAVKKTYLLLTDRKPSRESWRARSNIRRARERYVSGSVGDPAETRFRVIRQVHLPQAAFCIEAEPVTGRTHQVRVHAADAGVPVLGDRLYGGSAFGRVCLHAAKITFEHPATGRPMTFEAEVDFTADTAWALRRALIDFDETDAFRVIHGASDGWPKWYVDRFGDFLLSQAERVPGEKQREWLKQFASAALPARPTHTVYHKILTTEVRRLSASEAAPQLFTGTAAPDSFVVRENGVRYEASFHEGYSVGLFLDQRDNRRRLLTGHVAAGFDLRAGAPGKPQELLNTFAYTCSFSVCAAAAGWRATSLDLSKKHLDRGRRNFRLNGLDPEQHDFIYGDVFDWLRRFAKKNRAFDLVLLDPPTFSKSRSSGWFRAEKDYGKLTATALSVLKPGGVLFASTNSARWDAEEFLATVRHTAASCRRAIQQEHYVPQPPDFPISRDEPAYLKTVWLRVA